MPDNRDERIHFIGIGGAGMSSIALVLHQRGYAVTGSDLKRSRYVRELDEAGIPISIGHEAGTIDRYDPDIVVISSAVPETNPELIRAGELGIPVWHRARMLSFLSLGKSTVAVAGTHGKTTTSSMIAVMLDKMGLDPAFLIGGILNDYGTNGRDGTGEYFVAEADESDGSFMFLNPHIAVVTNIDKDHLDHYKTMDGLKEAFRSFMELVGDDGTVVIMGDDGCLSQVARESSARTVTYGFGPDNDYTCHIDRMEGMETDLSVTAPTGEVARVSLRHSPGRHNALNATAAVAVAGVLSLDFSEASLALSEFSGVGRRFTCHGTIDGVTVVDDYGHHPTEIRATLEAAKGLGFKRVICVFQPHRYTRTMDLMDEFGDAFDCADLLYVTDVFSAGELPIPGVSGHVLAEHIRQKGDVPVVYMGDRMELLDTVSKECSSGDLIVMQGAGDITTLIPSLLKRLENDS